MSSAWVPLGRIGPQFRDARAMVERIDTPPRPGTSDDWRVGPFVTVEQDGLGKITLMVEEMPELFERLRALVPVIEALATLKTEPASGDRRIGRSEEVAEGVLRRLFGGRHEANVERHLSRDHIRAFAIAAYEIGYLDGRQKGREGK